MLLFRVLAVMPLPPCIPKSSGSGHPSQSHSGGFSSSCSAPALLGCALPNSLSSSHGVPSLLAFLLPNPFQDFWLVFRPLLTLPPHCVFPLLPGLFLFCGFLLFLPRFQLHLASEFFLPFSGPLPCVATLLDFCYKRSFLPWLWPRFRIHNLCLVLIQG